MQNAFEKNSEVVEEVQNLTAWLSHLEDELTEQFPPPTSGKELQSIVKRHRQWKDELEVKADAMESAVQLGREAISAGVSAKSGRDLERDLIHLREKWSGVCQLVHQRLFNYQQAFEMWKEFQGQIVC